MEFKGIDVSRHQGSIDWEKVKSSGVQFALLRAGYGSDREGQDDARFLQNMAGCEAAGLPWGAYLYSYAMSLEEAESEAAHLLRLLRGKKPSYPIVIDMEDADGYKAKRGGIGRQLATDIVKTVCARLEGAGYYAMWYANWDWHQNRLCADQLAKYDFWLAHWGVEGSNLPCGIWQHTSDGAVPGISGRVDCDIAYKDYPAIIQAAGLNGRGQGGEGESGGGEEGEAERPLVPPRPVEDRTYTVQKGDTLWGIARAHGTTVAALAECNGIADPDRIYLGQVIQIGSGSSTSTAPTGGRTYTVQKGDSLWAITARELGSGGRYGEIKAANGLSGDTIYPGQVLDIPR
ncbi:LysM peptidoglycan-binding domain-containing protein [Acetanaerobacterium sp. MSJ-12]|uniref:glycoside hydrolase family 25 protein n=1 Tax=Acetanaerobacterium sp. MSJ-12 TaxID=2841535 RepID=UPI001C0EBB29|nr:LysM peptidoglycan-binding domain-containing protein [Acetanaerobacterium sp. MSJ-12]MBU5420021.1 LysM peptidoglycan-binding domain-containing protein [Acetanaerobacterium sp. MSJ-12]